MNSKIISLALLIMCPASLWAGEELSRAPQAPYQPPAPPSGESDLWGWGIGAQVGVQGVGLHLRRDIIRQLYLKVEGNYFEYDDTIEIDDVDYDGKLDLSNVGLTLNYLPFQSSGFRITAGAYYGNNSFEGRGTSSEEKFVKIDDTEYLLKGTNRYVSGSVEYDSVSPYFGLGWDWSLGARDNCVIGLDLGVLYMGDPSVSYKTNIPGVTAEQIKAETRDIESDIDDYKFLPVVKLSFTYRF